jgi:hypothetical protein
VQPYFFSVSFQLFCTSLMCGVTICTVMTKLILRLHWNSMHMQVKNDLSSIFAVVLHYPDGVVACCISNGMGYPLNYFEEVCCFFLRYLVDVSVVFFLEQQACALRLLDGYSEKQPLPYPHILYLQAFVFGLFGRICIQT